MAFDKVPARTADVWKTPLFEQYWKVKESALDCLLFFRMGDFYELFGEDAITAAPVLEVQLTARNKDSAEPVPMCGVPAHAIESYAEKLLGGGHKVALCEQLVDPIESRASGSKLVERGIVRILTPGLPVDPSRLEDKEPHWFVSVAPIEGGKAVEVEVFDFLGALLFEGSLDRPDELEDLFLRLSPREILAPASVLRDPLIQRRWTVFSENSPWHSRLTPWAGSHARGNLEDYLVYTQRVSLEQARKLLPAPKALAAISGKAFGTHARIPSTVLDQWAVFPQLFEMLDRAGSAVGSRRLRHLLSTPLVDPALIRLRQAAFEEFLGGHFSPDEFLAAAGEVYDFDRLLGRFRIGAAAPKELSRLVRSIESVARALDRAPVRNESWQALLATEKLPALVGLAKTLHPLREKLLAAVETELDPAREKGGELTPLVRVGFDAELDRLRSAYELAETWLADFETRLRNETQIASLKIRSNRVFGYYIEITKTHLTKVPAHFERKQTTVNGERFTCAELRGKETEILQSGVRSEARAREILEGLQADILAHEKTLRDWVEHFSWYDAIAGLSKCVMRLKGFGPWAKPTVLDGAFRFRIADGRHPILESLNHGGFIANSIELGFDERRILLLTGPNMAGKSTLMRQTGLCLLLAQCGLPVPASVMEFAPAHGFYSRMGASDRILSGESTFMVEMKETASIFREADADSFVLIDEIGRGTSTQDGLAIAQAVLEHLSRHTRSITLFATHYHELSELADMLPNVRNGSMAIREWEGELIFLRSLVLEPAQSSYGIHVAEMAGLPPEVIRQARENFVVRSQPFEASGRDRPPVGSETKTRRRKSAPETQDHDQLGLFFGAPPPAVDAAALARAQELDTFIGELARVEAENLSPRDSWKTLDEWIARSRKLRK